MPTECIKFIIKTLQPLFHYENSYPFFVLLCCCKTPWGTHSCPLYLLLSSGNDFVVAVLRKKQQQQKHQNSRSIADSTPVSQSRHTLRFQPIACRSIMRCPRVLTRPEMVWQAFVPDIASSQLAVFDMAEKNPGERNCCYGQCKSDERYPVKCAGVTF